MPLEQKGHMDSGAGWLETSKLGRPVWRVRRPGKKENNDLNERESQRLPA